MDPLTGPQGLPKDVGPHFETAELSLFLLTLKKLFVAGI